MTPFITPHEAKFIAPLPKHWQKEIKSFRNQVHDILTGRDRRMLLVVGPCSIHNEEGAIRYATLLKHLAESVKDFFFIVLRAYLEKPRSQSGWKGFIYDPELNGSHDMHAGIIRSRKLLCTLTELELPLACEFLDPIVTPYICDFFSWGSIGARTVESAIHRQLAASLDMPMGFKNRTDGNVDVAINACLASREAHHFLSIDEDGNVAMQHAPGNRLPHLVLRGGSCGSNYDSQSVQNAAQKLKKVHLSSGLIVDCSHDNSKKNHREQMSVFSSVIKQSAHADCPIRGIMLESFLLEARQAMQDHIAHDISVTDPCLDWQCTKELILRHAEHLSTCSVCV